MNLFDRARSVALSSALKWLPSGRKEGDELVCLNPLRADDKLGSFKINLVTGKWADFADDVSGNDLISCYAYLNRSSLEMAASDAGYKNIEGGIQAEAARELISQFDPTYFPGADDDFSRPAEKKKAGGTWDGYRQINTGLREDVDPMETLRYMERYNGEYNRHWTFTDKRGLPMFIVARYYKSGKKEDRPFTPWTNGETIRWRSKNLEDVLLPLYNLVGLEADQNAPVLMTEGQKNAEQAREPLSGDFVTTTVYRSPDKTDLEPLRGRTVHYWFDPDNAGRKKLKKMRELLEAIDCRFFAVHSPTGKPKGWDISDAIDEGWTREKLIAHIEGQPADSGGDEDSVGYLDDCDALPFRILGYTNELIYFFTKEREIVQCYKNTQVASGKAALMNLMDVKHWGLFFPNEQGGIKWEIAGDHVIKMANKTSLFYDENIRKSGVWREGGNVIVHAGDHIIRDGKRMSLYDSRGKYVYNKSREVPYSYDNPLTVEESARLLEVMDLLDFEDPQSRLFLAGWLLLAPFGGALTWRPSIWITGAKGAGKSHIMDEIIHKITHGFGVNALGASTPAGVRQRLDKSSLPIMLDEFEGDTKQKKETVTDVLSIMRQASSGAENNSGILQGTTDKNGTTLNVQSMFLFASISANLEHTADKSRIALLRLRTPRPVEKVQRGEVFERLLELESEIITDDFGKRFYARALTLLPEIMKACAVFRRRASQFLSTSRAGDQYGTLVGGAWMITNDIAPTDEQADAYLRENVDMYVAMDNDVDDEAKCLEVLLNHTIQIDTTRWSVGTWLTYWFKVKYPGEFDSETDFTGAPNYDLNTIRNYLGEVGVKPVKSREHGLVIQVATGHVGIKSALRETPWGESYIDMLGRLGFARKGTGSVLFTGGGRKGFIELGALDALGCEAIPF